MKEIVSVEAIANKIYMIRGMKVILDRDLSEGTSTDSLLILCLT